MTTEETKKEDNTYSSKIQSLLIKISKGEKEPPKAPIEEPVKTDSTWKKMKEMGGLQKGIPELFKLEESAFDVPSFISESNVEIEGTPYKRIPHDSSHSDALNYWKTIESDLKRIGKSSLFDKLHRNAFNVILEKDGKEKKVKVALVSDSENGDKPTVMFENAEIEIEDIIPLINRVGLKIDRPSIRKYNGFLIADISK